MAPNAYVANANSNNVSVVDTVGLTLVATVAVGNSPRGVTVTPDLSKVYVSNFTDNTVSVINAATNTVATVITVGTGPGGIAVTPDGSKVLVTNYSAGTVSVIATATNTVTGTITLPLHGAGATDPWAICISPDSTTAYVITETGPSSAFVEFCNIAALSVTASVVSNGGGGDTLRTIQGIAVTPDNATVFVTGRLGGGIDCISTTSLTVVTQMVDLTGEPASVCVLPNNSRGFWNNSTGNVYWFDPATFVVTSHTNLFGNDVLTGIAPTPDSTLVFSADSGPAPAFANSIVWKINSTTPTINSSLNTSENRATGIGISYYPPPVSEQIVMIV